MADEAKHLSDLEARALEAVVRLSRDRRFRPAVLKPCIAYHLDGGAPFAERHNVAFTLAIELRSMGLDRDRVTRTMARWARETDLEERRALAAVKSAFHKTPDGAWRYRGPGLKKDGKYEEVLGPICAAVGCPAHCAAYLKKYQGLPDQGFDRFNDLGWGRRLRRERQRAAIDAYQAICVRERQLGLGAGAPLYVTFKQISEISGMHYTSAGRALRALELRGLIVFVSGSGDGPAAANRKASMVRRFVPIPPASLHV